MADCKICDSCGKQIKLGEERIITSSDRDYSKYMALNKIWEREVCIHCALEVETLLDLKIDRRYI